MKYFVTDGKEAMKEMEVKSRKESGGEMKQIRIYPEVTYQSLIGIGGALTEASAYTYSCMSDEKKRELIDLYFSKENSGYSMCRLHIQSCDFALGNYAYVSDENDKNLEGFNISRDKKYILPFIKDVLAVNPDMEFLASPWSPAPFMKTNGEMNHGGKLKDEFAQMWADTIVKFLLEYRKEGVVIKRLTVQNEPAATQTWDSCIYSGKEEALFARDFLKPALVKAGLTDVKISVWDHNKEKILERAEESLSVDGANDVIDGVAFHWYTGDHFEILSETIKRFPDKEFIFTEGCVEYSRFSQNADLSHAQMYAHDMIGDLKAGANAFLDWNVILDAKGGPNHVGNYCGAPLMCDTDEDRIDIKPSYYYIRHFSHFIRPGAKRFLTSSYNRKLETVGFSNPDGSKVVIVLNESDEDLPFTLCDQDTQADFMMKANSIITILM